MHSTTCWSAFDSGRGRFRLASAIRRPAGVRTTIAQSVSQSLFVATGSTPKLVRGRSSTSGERWSARGATPTKESPLEFRDFSPPTSPTFAEQSDALAKGLGRAMQWAMAGKLDDAALHHACTHDLRFDRQCEDSRTPWNWTLLEAAGAVERLRDPILSSAIAVVDERDVGSFSEIAYEYAIRGDEAFRRQLYTFCALDDCLTAGELIIKLDDATGLLFVARQFGKHTDPDEQWMCGSLLSSAEEKMGTERVDQVLSAAENPSVLQFRDTALEFRGYLQSTPRSPERPSVEDVIDVAESVGPRNYRRWGHSATVEELNEIAAQLLTATNPKTLQTYLSVFSNRAFPVFDPKLLELCDHEDDMVRWKAFVAIEMNSHPSIRALAEKYLLEGICSRTSASLFKRNFRAGDEVRLLEALQPPDESNQLHWLLSTIEDVLELNPEANSAKIGIAAYAIQPCSNCRGSVAKLLTNRNCAPQWLREECRFDCDLRTRESFAS